MKDNLLRNSKRYLKRQKAKGWKRHSIMANDELWQQIQGLKRQYQLLQLQINGEAD